MPVLTRAWGVPSRVLIAFLFGMARECLSLNAATALTRISSTGRSGFGGMNSPSGSSESCSFVPQTVISRSTAS